MPNKVASTAEMEIEKLLKEFLPGTPFANKAKAVGGYVRDHMLAEINKTEPNVKDLDIVVDGDPGSAERFTKFIAESFPGKTSSPREMGKGYPIWSIAFKEDIEIKGKVFHTQGGVIEVADTMTETYPDPNSRQRVVEHGTMEEDVARRDFTVNMLLKDLTTGEIEDFTGKSKEDIRNGVLTHHPEVDPDQMFSQDPLRMIRLIRFQVKYGWDIPLFMLKSVKRNAERIQIVSPERIQGELEKILKVTGLHKAVRLLSATGLLPYVMPEVEALKGMEHNPVHHAEGDAYKHTMMVLENAPPTIEGQLSALLHDVGKATTQTIDEKGPHYYGHEKASKEIADAMLTRLGFSKPIRDKVVDIVSMHMKPMAFLRDDKPTDKSIRKFIREVGDNLEAVLDQATADERGRLPASDKMTAFREHVRRVLEKDKEPKSDGKHLGNMIMGVIGIPPGPLVKKYIEALMDKQDEVGPMSKEEQVAYLRSIKGTIEKEASIDRLDQVANSLEKRGLTDLAEKLDMVSNSLEKK